MRWYQAILRIILGVGLLLVPAIIPDNNGSPTDAWSLVFILWFAFGIPFAGALIASVMTGGKYYPDPGMKYEDL